MGWCGVWTVDLELQHGKPKYETISQNGTWSVTLCMHSLGEIGFDSKIEEKNSKYWGEIYKMT